MTFLSLPDTHLSFSETAIYAQGVGLGASKGKELGKYTEGFSNYVHMVQDAVSAIYSSVLIADFLELLGTGAIWKLIRLGLIYVFWLQYS